jgi:hypothetical protein
MFWRMRTGTTLALAAALLSFAPGVAMAGAESRPVVVELFTSQGCSSCPPADELLGRLTQRPGVVALSLPITYWNMLGWKDTLATEANTRRQKAYAALMKHGGVYTPQIIVDGVTDVVGSRDGEVEAAIAKRAAEIEVAQAHREVVAASREAAAAMREAALAESAYRDQTKSQTVEVKSELVASRRAALLAAREANAPANLSIPVSVIETPAEMRVLIGAANDKDAHDATVWLFHLRKAVTVAIGAGENEGRTMTYHNVVGDVRQVGTWKGEALTIDLPRSALSNLPHDAVAVVVQQAGYGRIVGATLISHPEYEAQR